MNGMTKHLYLVRMGLYEFEVWGPITPTLERAAYFIGDKATGKKVKDRFGMVEREKRA